MQQRALSSGRNGMLKLSVTVHFQLWIGNAFSVLLPTRFWTRKPAKQSVNELSCQAKWPQRRSSFVL